MLFRSNDTATTEIYTSIDTLSLHDALPISLARNRRSFVTELQGYHANVMAWSWPTYVAMLLAWIAVIISLFSVARRILLRRSTQVDKATPGKSED